MLHSISAVALGADTGLHIYDSILHAHTKTRIINGSDIASAWPNTCMHAMSAFQRFGRHKTETSPAVVNLVIHKNTPSFRFREGSNQRKLPEPQGKPSRCHT